MFPTIPGTCKRTKGRCIGHCICNSPQKQAPEGWLVVRGELVQHAHSHPQLEAYGLRWTVLPWHSLDLGGGAVAVSPEAYVCRRLAGYAERHDRVKSRLVRAAGAKAVARARAAGAKAKAATR